MGYSPGFHLECMETLVEVPLNNSCDFVILYCPSFLFYFFLVLFFFSFCEGFYLWDELD
ncbi:hypothetical protein BDZ94DRAFT_1268791 [Collybia nuda]|uniref:Uncharacterized protein n=1 Tax=Collybia nuda TaxID=64659 RepID=A0A9P6CBB1_9AGAR|nr:hypothetical protein BDZ94DRAFT_1268791 [Collybia nuda]